MMFAWSFAARTVEEVTRLVRVLGKHRYVHEVDHRIHWAVDAALAQHPTFAPHAAAFEAQRRREPGLDPTSRDPRLHRAATIDEVHTALTVFWSAEQDGATARERLLDVLVSAGLSVGEHEPWHGSPEEPPHPELLLLDWVLLPVNQLDAERHAGAIDALKDTDEESDPAVLIYQEGPILAAPELTRGARNGVLSEEFLVWSEEPYLYADYVFRGAAKAAKLGLPPCGYFDL